MTYVIVFIVIFILNEIYKNKGLYNKKKFCIFCSILIILLLVLRNDYVGTDTQNYRFIYDNITNEGYYHGLEDFKISNEIGFYTMIYWMKTFEIDFRVLLLISAVFYVLATSFIIYKYSENAFLSYFLFFVNGFFIFNTTMRHCFALSFFVFAVYFAIQRKIIPYFILIGLAILFHSSAIVILPVYWLIKLDLNKKLYVVLTVSMIGLVAISPLMFPYVEIFFDKKYEAQDTGGVFRTILNFLIAIFSIYYYNKMDSSNKTWLLFILFSIVLTPIAKLNPAFFRIIIYFTFFSILLIPNLFKVKSINAQVFVFSLICFGLLNFTYLSKQAGVRTHPYVFYWEDYWEHNPDARKLNLI
ncbi:hypothetical protein Bcop_1862 [Bacteroides coprosuis DSM 18011]|uniref:EpsG family protein n=1 Tax=Bacteroides coprosuis DSM 18011 TaxID=679937 RepID=F3ZS29_9BACE|nr:EpsG family protein [Bacteroides coprosuis]EGJ72050.1 hypothetical protein Bcop_1862 [Bacteroides coprosuis DSM 18011]